MSIDFGGKKGAKRAISRPLEANFPALSIIRDKARRAEGATVSTGRDVGGVGKVGSGWAGNEFGVGGKGGGKAGCGVFPTTAEEPAVTDMLGVRGKAP